MSSEWIVAIITSMFAVAAAALTCRWQMKTEMRKILENYVSDKKYKAYYNAVNLLGCSVRCSEKQMLKSPVKLLI